MTRPLQPDKISTVETWLRRPYLPPLILLALTLALFGDVLFAARPPVLSDSNADIATLFAHWRNFGFGEMRHGNLAQWNPYLACGYPFLANFQSALLYPLNAIYLVLPLAQALNVDIALHVFLAGWFTYLWAVRRGLHPLAGLLAAALLMCCDPFFFHIFAGHLTPIAVMAWSPLLFLVADELLKRPSLKWTLLGMGAVALQLLAGYPQYLFFTAFALALYVLCHLLINEERRTTWRALAALAAIYAGGAALGAVQLLPGLKAAATGVRGGGLSFKAAAEFSLTPHSFLTLLAPRFFGDLDKTPYWGSSYAWEVSLFFGVVGLVLALHGLRIAPRPWKFAAIATIGILLLLALGSFTPLYALFYHYVPGFNSFRAVAKLVYPVALLLVLAAAYGLDRLLRDGAGTRLTAAGALALAALTAGGGLAIQSDIAAGLLGWWGHFVRGMLTGADANLQGRAQFKALMENPYQLADFTMSVGRNAATQLYIAAACLLLTGLLVFACRRARRAAYLVACLAVVEAFVFARAHRPTFDLQAQVDQTKARFFAAHPGDHRYLQLAFNDDAMSYRVGNMGGYDPCLPRRYAEFIAWTQGRDLDEVDAYLTISNPHRLFSMLRAKYVVLKDDSGATQFGELGETLPRALLVDNYKEVQGRDAILGAMEKPDFDPRRTVILEDRPWPGGFPFDGPVTPGAHRAVVVESTPTSLTIDATVANPTTLLITDGYDAGWKIVDGPWTVMPANYVLQGIPLYPGQHRIRLRYETPGLAAGRAITIISLVLYGIAWLTVRKRRVAAAGEAPATDHE